jgi:hypothetical protein
MPHCFFVQVDNTMPETYIFIEALRYGDGGYREETAGYYNNQEELWYSAFSENGIRSFF